MNIANIPTYIKYTLIMILIIVVGNAAYQALAHNAELSVVDAIMTLCLVQSVR